MRRVVVDVGVLVSGLITRGAPADIVDQWMDGAFELVVSPRLLEELREVLLRKKFSRYITSEDAVMFVELLRLAGTEVPDPDEVPGLTPDPKDDYLVLLARSSGAACIVSGDAHLTELPDPVPQVLTPRQFLGKLS